MTRAPKLEFVLTRQQRIAELARSAPRMAFTSLAHHIDQGWLLEARMQTRRDGAVGVDGQTASDYQEHLLDNLDSLLDRAKSGTYRAPPVRRTYIPKGTGSETRPLGIPTYEDKILQRAVVMVLEPLYEQDFRDCSYGFRPGRSAHQALEALWKQTMDMGGCWIVEVDIRRFFDTLDHARLRKLLQLRVRDGVLLRLIGKWLNAGVLEDGSLEHPQAGTPQGGVISPLLANIYLHYVLDLWFEMGVKPRLRGKAFLVRYADDFVMGFACEEDARKIMEVLPKRFAMYGLTIHPEKTRLVPFRRPQSGYRRGGPRTGLKPGVFDLLGFRHYWARSRRGHWVVKRKTASSRFQLAVKKIALWCRKHRHDSIRQQHRTLCQKLRGHYGYYGITGNAEPLRRFEYLVKRLWRKWLSRRTNQARLPWDRFIELLQHLPLPPPRVVHSVYRSV